jgi:hypothetical protein
MNSMRSRCGADRRAEDTEQLQQAVWGQVVCFACRTGRCRRGGGTLAHIMLHCDYAAVCPPGRMSRVCMHVCVCVRARMSCSLCLLVVWAATLSPVLAVLLCGRCCR